MAVPAETYNSLKEAYLEDNLNRISALIIDCFKSGKHLPLHQLAEMVKPYVPIRTDKINKCYTGLIMLYHPDKAEFYQKEIDRLFENKQYNDLEKYTHILQVNGFFQNTSHLNDSFDIDYHPQYVWDYENLGYGFHYESENDDWYYYNLPVDIESDNSFYGALKRKIYGSLHVELQEYLLEDIEDIDMPDSSIEFLDGIQYCKYTTYVDLSRNRLNDIEELLYLIHVEELFLSGNQIDSIQALIGMSKLRYLDISNNFITDFSPLLMCHNLEFVNVRGNKIPQNMIEALKKRDVIVLF